jgi:hypothetical protein
MEVVEIYEKKRGPIWKRAQGGKGLHEIRALNSSTLFMYFKERVPSSLADK